ncbi:glycoside hydrolase family 26 protein [Streptomyces smaragdinus]|uniref:glycoside hydrolase family 26 protein n=1 Tax=Streptomyces smaragdinus TaxID=2585196 RepID=UPI001296A553|nr:glycosyl hydrolase [Streptomyces smaragdinus]
MAARARDTGGRGRRKARKKKGAGPRTGLVVALGLLAALVVGAGSYALGEHNPAPVPAAARDGRDIALPAVREDGTPIPGKDRFLNPGGGAKYFGIAAPHVPWRPSVLRKVTKDAGGVAPNMAEYFVKWTQEFDPSAVQAAHDQRALPVLSWEPWAGKDHGTEQPEYRLRTIVDGDHDPYIEKFAAAVAKDRWPVAIRMAHEMNGRWYPWAQAWNGNRPGEYTAAWRHIRKIFDRAGADNVIWIWSPNILRGAADVPLESLYPGDEYVDWIGLSAYGSTETDAADVMEPTLDTIREFTAKPLLITETGARPGQVKVSFTDTFFPWLAGRDDVVGFIWFQYTREEGGGTDWTFTSGPQAQAAFKKGVKTLPLVEMPEPPKEE